MYLLQDVTYPMYLPRMGQAIIINNVAAEMPGSLADVEALQAAYKDVGFDVYTFTDCTAEVSVLQTGFLSLNQTDLLLRDLFRREGAYHIGISYLIYHNGLYVLLKKMAQKKMWLMAEETHQYCNALAVHIICHGSNSTDVLDVNKHKAFTLQNFADDLDKVENLENKSKLLMVQKCRGKASVLPMPNLLFESSRQNKIIIYCFEVRDFLFGLIWL